MEAGIPFRISQASKLKERIRDYYALTKPEVNLLILMTTSAGYVLGASGPLHVSRLLHALAGTLLVASGTATLNQYMERSHDALMRRTRNRPLPAERLHPKAALSFGIICSLAGGAYLSIVVNLVCAAVAIATLLSYLLIYTPQAKDGLMHFDWSRAWCNAGSNRMVCNFFPPIP